MTIYEHYRWYVSISVIGNHRLISFAVIVKEEAMRMNNAVVIYNKISLPNNQTCSSFRVERNKSVKKKQLHVLGWYGPVNRVSQKLDVSNTSVGISRRLIAMSFHRV
jgi:hypothetical protein